MTPDREANAAEVYARRRARVREHQGGTLRQAITEAHLSIAGAARIMGISRAQVYARMSGEADLPLSEAVALCEALRIPLARFAK